MRLVPSWMEHDGGYLLKDIRSASGTDCSMSVGRLHRIWLNERGLRLESDNIDLYVSSFDAVKAL